MENTEKQLSAKPTRGRGGKHNFPNAKIAVVTDEDKALVSGLLTEVLTEYKQEKVTSDEELASRIDDYFLRCATRGQIPTVEEMALSTGYSISTVWDWETGRRKGFSTLTAEIIKKAKDTLKTFDAKLVISGKLNVVSYIFRSKNYYGLSDTVEHVLTPNTQPETEYSAEDIKRRYMLPDGGDSE